MITITRPLEMTFKCFQAFVHRTGVPTIPTIISTFFEYFSLQLSRLQCKICVRDTLIPQKTGLTPRRELFSRAHACDDPC